MTVQAPFLRLIFISASLVFLSALRAGPVAAAAADGVCGPSAGGAFHLAPTANLCAAGEAGSVTVDFYTGNAWAWYCFGIDGGAMASCSAKIPPTRAILVLGGGDYIGNEIWDATVHLGQYAYESLRDRKLEKTEIKVLSPVTDLDLDGDGAYDAEPAYLENLEDAITLWGRNHRLIL